MRRRPVVAAGVAGADFADRRPIPDARGGQEHTALSGKGSPLSRGTLGCVFAVAVDGAPRGSLAAGNGNAVGEQNHAVDAGAVGIDGGVGVTGVAGAIDGPFFMRPALITSSTSIF